MAESPVLRHISWLLNAVLIALCCFLAARIAYTGYDALRGPRPELAEETTAAPVPRKARTWSDREVILTRNLFNASLLAPAEPPPPPEEEIEETELPLGLLGTISSSRTEVGWAAVWDAESKRSLVVKPGDAVGNGQAIVLSIERERVLLSENEATRELLMDEDGQYRPPKRPPPRRKARANRGQGRRRGRR